MESCPVDWVVLLPLVPSSLMNPRYTRAAKESRPSGTAYLLRLSSLSPCMRESSTTRNRLALLRLNGMGSLDFLKASHLLLLAMCGEIERRELGESSHSCGCAASIMSKATPSRDCG